MIRSLLGFIKGLPQQVSSLGGFKLLQIAIYSLSMVAFFIGLDYFSSKPSIEIRNEAIPPLDRGITINSLLPFYKKNNLDIPKYFIAMPKLRDLFFYENEEDLGMSFTPPEMLEGIKKIDKFNVPDDLIKELEQSVGEIQYKKRAWFFGGEGRGIKKKNLNAILKLLRENSTKNEYYTFLAALIYSRVVANTIMVRNDGDIDLKDIKVLIPSPFSRVSDTRDDNLLEFKPVSRTFHEIVRQGSSLTLQIPYLKKGEFLSVNILSRENQIDVEEIVCNFQEDFKINNRMCILVSFLLIFVVLVFTCTLLKAENIKD